MGYLLALLFVYGVLRFLVQQREKQQGKLAVKKGTLEYRLYWEAWNIYHGEIPRFIDAFFETVSGFTTTGSSVLFAEDFAKLWAPESTLVGMRGMFFWRSFTNWIGGMGVLVFVLAVMPKQDTKSSRLVHVMRAEMPGPKVDKIVSTVKKTSAIMYGIYAVMTAILVVMLLFGGMDPGKSAAAGCAAAALCPGRQQHHFDQYFWS